MKTIGIIGGLGPESTVDYYKEIIAAFNSKYDEMVYTEIIIFSANINEFLKEYQLLSLLRMNNSYSIRSYSQKLN